MILCAYDAISQPRLIRLTYTCYLTNLPPEAKLLNCWIPVPSSDERQQVTLVTRDLQGGRITTESKYGNRMYYKQVKLQDARLGDTLKITLAYEVLLNERSIQEAKQGSLLPKIKPPEKLQVYLAENRLIPWHGIISTLGENMQLPEAPIPAARKIYDNLIDRMVYNYKAPGAGFGDAIWACNSKTGDCSDYHSVFIGICRSQGIPADHVFGLPLKNAAENHQVKDWHCWARFWVQGPGWITIDASEADKHPEQRDYLFGTLSNTYLNISHGRDVILEPQQKGSSLNIFADPYAEIDNTQFTGIKWVVFFEEIKKPV